jgi:hypothetical protein
MLSHRELDALRGLGDAEADATVAALGTDAWIANSALRHVHRNDEPLPAAVPAVVRRFFEEHFTLPSDVDHQRVARAQAFAARHLLPIMVSLLYASLPTTYGAARGARVLAATGRLAGRDLDRRVNETAQFLLDVLAPDGFSPRGSALRAIQKVRLMHAAVRAQLARTTREQTLREVAINQEDLLGTLFAFSTVVIRALRRLEITVSPDDAEDYYQLWRIIGRLLGVGDQLLPRDFHAACDLSDRIVSRHIQASEHGRQLMAELLAGMERHVPSALQRAPRVLVRHLVGDELADALAVPPDGALQATLAVARLLPRAGVLSVGSLVRRLATPVAMPLLAGVVGAKLGGALPAFAMPLSISDG